MASTLPLELIATQPYSKNCLFLIPDIKSQEEALEPEAQGGENQAIVDLENYEMSQKNIQELEMELAHTTEVLERGYQAIEGQEDRRMDGQQTGKEEDGIMAGQQMRGEDDSDCDLLDQEKDNAANSRILDKQIIIYFKKG
jgi:hypothetical protein